MKHVIDLSWKESMAFVTEIDGHKLTVDAGEEVGGKNLGPRPKKLMLVALAGCTGMDVISILDKMKIKPDTFNVIVEGDVTEDHPKHYSKMKVIYRFSGKNLLREKLEKAVDLSLTKYCGVSAVYKKVVDFDTEIQIVGD